MNPYDIRLPGPYAVPQPDIQPKAPAKVRVQFRDGLSISASGVSDVYDEDDWLIIEQENGDYTRIPVHNNIQYVEVTYGE